MNSFECCFCFKETPLEERCDAVPVSGDASLCARCHDTILPNLKEIKEGNDELWEKCIDEMDEIIQGDEIEYENLMRIHRRLIPTSIYGAINRYVSKSNRFYAGPKPSLYVAYLVYLYWE